MIKEKINKSIRKMEISEMKRKALYVLIVTLLLSAIMVSCNSEVADSASQGNKLVNVTVMAGVPKSITVTTSSGTDVESLYWFYTANKTDGSIFIDGQTGDVKTPVKKEGTTPIIGLVNSDLGLFSTGGWSFSFWGYKEADNLDSDTNKPVYYQENLAATVVARTDLTLTLVEGEGMADATLVFDNPTWTYELAPGKTLTLRVFDGDPLNGGEELDLNGSSTEGNGVSATTNESGVATFEGIVNQTIESGAHTLYFVVYHNNGNVDVEVGRTILGLNLKKGTTYTLSGSIENLNETYHVWVTAVTKTTASSEVSMTGSAEAVSIPASVTPLSAESSVAVSDTEKTTTVSFVSGALDYNTSSSETVDSLTTTTNTTIKHELDVEVKTSDTASSAQYVIDYGTDTPVAGINLTLTKNTTISEVVTEGSTTISSNTSSSSTVLTDFNDNSYATIATYIGKNLSSVRVYYNGTGSDQPIFNENNSTPDANTAKADGTSSNAGTGYNPTTGLLVFKTNHFSEFFVTSASVARIGEVHYGSLQAAIDAAKAGETIVLLKNNLTGSYTFDYPYVQEVALDLGSYTLNADLNIRNASVEIKNGTISTNSQTIKMYGSATDNSKYLSKVVIDETATVTGDYSVILRESNLGILSPAYGMVLDIYGTVNGVVWPMGNITSGNSQINVYSGAVMNGGVDMCIANQGYVTTTIHSGTRLTGGESAIEARSGIVNIEGGEFISTYTGDTTSTYKNSGTTTKGAAFAFAPYGNSSLVVNISGGTFTGKTAVYLTNPNNVGTSPENIFNISGGTFIGTNNYKTAVGDSGNLAGFISPSSGITGGTFSSDPTPYVMDGYYADVSSEEMWVVKQVPDAPLAKVIRYVYDNNNSYEIDYVKIEAEDVEVLDIKTNLGKISQIQRDVLKNFGQDSSIEMIQSAIDTGTLVTFLPYFDTRDRLVKDLPASDKFYSDSAIDGNGDINNLTELLSCIDLNNSPWRAEFRIVPKSLTESEMNYVSIVGSYFGMVVPFNLGNIISGNSASDVWVMNETYPNEKDYVTYDLLLGLCGSDENGIRRGFTCGAYLNGDYPKSIIGKTITVQLILTNDNLVESNEPYTYFVCAEVECTFHAPVVTSN